MCHSGKVFIRLLIITIQHLSDLVCIALSTEATKKLFFVMDYYHFFTNYKPHGESKLTGYSLIKVRSLRNMHLCFTLQIIDLFFSEHPKDTVNNQFPAFKKSFSTPNCIFILENKSFLQDHHTSLVSFPSHFLFKSLLHYFTTKVTVCEYISTEMVALLQTCSNMERSTVS